MYTRNKPLVTATITKTTLRNHLTRLLDKGLSALTHCQQTLKHIAVVYQGTVSSDHNRLLRSPITELRDVDLASVLQHRYGVSVAVLNDSKMIASALYHQRQGTDATDRNFAAILLSYGIGLGMFHGGALLSGSSSSGTEFGHMLLQADGALCRCGRYGCIEAYASDYAIWRRAHKQHEHTVPADTICADDFAQLVRAAETRNGPERRAFTEAGAAIGLGLTNLFALLDPFPVVLVGTSSAAFRLMEASLKRNLRHFEPEESNDLITVYDQQSESSLILLGASRRALEHIDVEVFGFGERHEPARDIHSV